MALVSKHFGGSLARLLIVKTASRFGSVTVDGTIRTRACLRLGRQTTVKFSSQILFQVRKLESITFKLLDIVKDISDAIDGDFLKVVDPLADNLENPLVLVRFANVADDVFAVGAVDAQLLRRITFVFQFLQDF